MLDIVPVAWTLWTFPGNSGKRLDLGLGPLPGSERGTNCRAQAVPPRGGPVASTCLGLVSGNQLQDLDAMWTWGIGTSLVDPKFSPLRARLSFSLRLVSHSYLVAMLCSLG